MMHATAMRLRDYHRADFELIWELDQECFPPGIAYSRSELRAFLSRKTVETIVAERHGRVVAFVLGWRRSQAEGHVITLDVAASVRRQGLGQQLLVALERRFRAAGVKRVQLETAVTNMRAIAFYERLGYQKVAHLDRYYGPGLHAWRMAKTLDVTGQPPTAPSPREYDRGMSLTPSFEDPSGSDALSGAFLVNGRSQARRGE